MCNMIENDTASLGEINGNFSQVKISSPEEEYEFSLMWNIIVEKQNTKVIINAWNRFSMQEL